MNGYGLLLWDLLSELLHKWPLAMIWYWAFPLFFAGTAFSLARLGIAGRGLPLTTGRRRLKGWPSKIGSAMLVVFGLLICVAFIYWLGFALYRQIAGLD